MHLDILAQDVSQRLVNMVVQSIQMMTRQLVVLVYVQLDTLGNFVKIARTRDLRVQIVMYVLQIIPVQIVLYALLDTPVQIVHQITVVFNHGILL